MTGGFLPAIESLADTWAGWMWAMTWQVSLLVLILSVATWFARRQSANLLHLVWLLVLVRLVLPPAFACPTGWAWWAFSAPMADVPETPRTPVVTSPRPMRFETGVNRLPAAAAAVPTGNADAVTPVSTGLSWTVPLMFVWAGVSLSMLVRLAHGQIKVRRWVREASPIDDAAIWTMLKQLRQSIGITHWVDLRNSSHCTTPVVVGFLRPTILLPAPVLSQLEPDELRTVLAHELTHIARRDSLVSLVQALLTSVYFFNPLVWWAQYRIGELTEEACDELTVRALEGRRKSYGTALLKVASQFGYEAPPLALGVMESKKPAVRRLKRILDPKLPQSPQVSLRNLAIVIISAALLLPSSGRPAQGIETAVTPPASIAEPRSAVQRPPVSQPASPGPAAVALPTAAQWHKGDQLAYSVLVKADWPEETLEMHGSVLLRVDFVGPQGTVFEPTATLLPARWPKQGANRFGLPSRPPMPQFPGFGVRNVLRRITLDRDGQLQESVNPHLLPVGLGDVARWVLLPLDVASAGVPQSRVSALEWQAPSSPDVRGFPPIAEPATYKMEGDETLTVSWPQVAGEKPGERTFDVVYMSATKQQVEGEPQYQVTGQGRGTILVQSRQMVSLDMRLSATDRTSGTSVEVPISLTVSLQNAGPATIPKPRDPMDASLVNLSSRQASRIKAAVSQLEANPPTQRDPKLAAALLSAVAQSEDELAARLARLAARVSTAENNAALIRLLDHSEPMVRWAAMEGLAAAPGADGARAIARRVKDDRLNVHQALRKMGPLAEAAVLGWQTDAELLIDLCSLLKDIGTPASIPTLETLLKSSEAQVRRDALQAVDAIRRRHK